MLDPISRPSRILSVHRQKFRRISRGSALLPEVPRSLPGGKGVQRCPNLGSASKSPPGVRPIDVKGQQPGPGYSRTDVAASRDPWEPGSFGASAGGPRTDPGRDLPSQNRRSLGYPIESTEPYGGGGPILQRCLSSPRQCS